MYANSFENGTIRVESSMEFYICAELFRIQVYLREKVRTEYISGENIKITILLSNTNYIAFSF